MPKSQILSSIKARLEKSSDTAQEQRVLDQQKVIDSIQRRLDIAPEQNAPHIQEELLKARNKLDSIRDAQTED